MTLSILYHHDGIWLVMWNNALLKVFDEEYEAIDYVKSIRGDK
jgi:hypothetical protein